ncbi:hypothetical protein NCC49_004360 [Naganishia albida]|nr:hypothetical protein NCC49_004360 [Naganishia albida]
MSSKTAPARKAGTSSSKTNQASKSAASSAAEEVADDDFGGYGSDIAPTEGVKKPKTAAAKAKKPKDDHVTPMEHVQKDDEPRKRTSSRIQSKGKSADLSQTSANISSKPSTKSSSQTASENAGKGNSSEENEDTDLRARIKEMTSEIAKMRTQLDRRTDERDGYAKQVKELKDKKAAVSDELYDKYKAAADSRATAQDQVIDTLQKLNDKLTSRVETLERDLKTAKTAKPVEKEVKKVPEPDADAMKKLKARLQAAEEESKQKDIQLKDYETEVKLAKDALASANKKLVTAQSASSITRDAEETAKDSDIIKWYEDLTNLVVLSVKVHQGDCGREVTFVCVETLAEHSLSFRARCYTTAKEDPSKAGSWIYTKQVDYTPIGLEAEKDSTFLARLDMLKDPFTFTRDQAYAFMANLQEKMTAEEDAEQ